MPTLVAHHGSDIALNFDYVAFRQAVDRWKGTRIYKEAAEAAGINTQALYRFLKYERLLSWENAQRLLSAMRLDAEAFLR